MLVALDAINNLKVGIYFLHPVKHTVSILKYYSTAQIKRRGYRLVKQKNIIIVLYQGLHGACGLRHRAVLL